MTELIARIAGPYLLITAIGFLISRPFYERMILGNQNTDPVTVNLSGAAHFVVGMIVLVNHFLLSSLAQIAVTLIGIGASLKGAALIALPERTIKAPKTVGATLLATAAGFGLVGFYLCYVGYLT